LKHLKDRLWEGADQLRANSGLKSNEYATPILGLIFLRFAENKYSQYEAEIIAEYEKNKGQRTEQSIHEIAVEKCGYYLLPEVRFEYLLNLPESEDLALATKTAMEEVEKYTVELADTLPKDVYYDVNGEDDPLVLAKLFKVLKVIIDAYNASGSQNDDFYEKLLEFMEQLKAEEERHIKEDLTEEELELYDLLRKDKLTKYEEQRVKLAAKQLYETLTTKKDELFVKGWHEDAQPKEKVRSVIRECLDATLPDSYDREIFATKSTRVYQHIVDQAVMGLAWAA
jgi:hypothetical protein